MSAPTAKISRDDLLREIFGTLRQWSELERNIFARAHYHGQSPESISRLFKMDVKDVRVILKQCDHRLYISLREFRKGSCEKRAHIDAETAETTACSRILKSDQRISSKEHRHPGSSRIAI